MPKPTHLTWEEAAVNALCNSTSYRMLVSARTARDMKQGDVVLVWGATGRHRRLRRAVRAQRRRHPVGVVSSPEKAALLHELGVRGGHRPQGRGLPVLGRRAHPGRGRVAPLRQGDPRRSSARTPTSCSSTPAARRWARRSSSASGAARSSRARRRRGYMVEFDNRHFWMKLKRLIASHFANYHEAWAGQPADRPGPHPAAAVGRVPARRGRRGGPHASTATSTRASSACSAWRPRRASASTTPSAGPPIGEDRITLFRRARRLTTRI